MISDGSARRLRLARMFTVASVVLPILIVVPLLLRRRTACPDRRHLIDRPLIFVVVVWVAIMAVLCVAYLLQVMITGDGNL
jgi:hypothetical protein